MYQNEVDDAIVTPAHLLLVPSDISGTANFINFRDIGVSTLRESSAFSKIRNFSKAYSTQLALTPTYFTSKYQQLHSLYMNESSILPTSSFGVQRQHNVAAISTLGNGFSSTLLDGRSFTQFLDSSTNTIYQPYTTHVKVQPSPLTTHKKDLLVIPNDFTRRSILLSECLGRLCINYPLVDFNTSLESLNDNSDKDNLEHPILNLHQNSLLKGLRQNTLIMFTQSDVSEPTSSSTIYSNLTLGNYSYNTREVYINGPNSKVLLNDQSIRSIPTDTLSTSHLNFSLGANTVSSNLQLAERINKSTTPYLYASSLDVGFVDTSLTAQSLSSQAYSKASHSAVQTSHPLGFNSLLYDIAKPKTVSQSYHSSGLLKYSDYKILKPVVGEVFIGSREKTPKSINTSY